MKSFLALSIIFFGYLSLFAQINVPGKNKSKCYEKADSRKNNKYADWECGKLAGVVDCNEKLTYDEDTKLILSGNLGAPFTGTCESCHLNGLLERRISFVNGKENGVDTSYYKSGCQQVIRNHIQGVESGQWTYFYDSTNFVAWERNYNLGQLHGPQLYLTKNGDTTRFEHYKNGVLHGIKKSYYPLSKLEKEVSYVDGQMDGPFKFYNFEGKIVQDLNFSQGKKNGECKYYYENGVLMSIEHWEKELKNGEFKTFYIQGTIQSSENYKKGVMEGWFEERYPNDKIKRRALYKKGVLVEEHRFDEHGVENYTFGENVTSSADEDHVMPGAEKRRKKKKDTKQGGLIKVE